MRKSLLLTSLCLLSFPALGAEFGTHRVDVGLNVHYGSDPAQVADVYTQANAAAAAPTLIWFHGGGWVGGDKAGSLDRVRPYLERGWNAANVNYRIGAGTAPQAIDDALCAYKFVVDEARKAGRGNRFVVSGASAGGHLALLVGMLNTSGNHPCKASVAPSAIVSWYGVTDIAFTEKFSAETNPGDNFSLTWAGSKARVAEISARYSPVLLVSERTPPIITVHGNADNVAPYAQATALHAMLRTRNRLITIEGGKHGGFSAAQTSDALAAIFTFLGE